MNPIQILLVEDNQGNILLTTEAFEDAKIINKISIARYGDEAIQFLENRGKYDQSKDFLNVIANIESYWINMVQLPGNVKK